MNLIYYALALFSGLLLPLQAGINSLLSKHLKHPAWAALVSFTVGAIGLAIYSALAARPAPVLARATLTSPPWWLWIGGLIGALYVTVSLIAAPRIGALGLLAAGLAGQAIASLILDHFGLLGFPVHRINPGRIGGVLLLLAGVALVHRY
jgi:transporter family-2 protein